MTSTAVFSDEEVIVDDIPEAERSGHEADIEKELRLLAVQDGVEGCTDENRTEVIQGNEDSMPISPSSTEKGKGGYFSFLKNIPSFKRKKNGTSKEEELVKKLTAKIAACRHSLANPDGGIRNTDHEGIRISRSVVTEVVKQVKIRCVPFWTSCADMTIRAGTGGQEPSERQEPHVGHLSRPLLPATDHPRVCSIPGRFRAHIAQRTRKQRIMLENSSLSQVSREHVGIREDTFRRQHHEEHGIFTAAMTYARIVRCSIVCYPHRVLQHRVLQHRVLPHRVLQHRVLKHTVVSCTAASCAAASCSAASCAAASYWTGILRPASQPG
jgi:hypothetical protein